MAENVWFYAIVLGPILFGLVIAYAITRQRKVTRAEHELSERMTRENYGKVEKR